MSARLPNDKLSAKEAALLAQVRAELARQSAAKADAAAPQPGVAHAQPPQQAGAIERDSAPPSAAVDPAQRAAALLAAAQADAENLRKRQRQLYVWLPVAFICVAGLWTLLWMWQHLR